jgi:hypothetical protein
MGKERAERAGGFAGVAYLLAYFLAIVILEPLLISDN